jgi:hypothetical protein
MYSSDELESGNELAFHDDENHVFFFDAVGGAGRGQLRMYL